MPTLSMKDHLGLIDSGKVPAGWEDQDVDTALGWFDDDAKAAVHNKLKQLSKQKSTTVVIGPVDPPRQAIDTCLALVRKLGILRDEHRSLQTALHTRDDALADLKHELAFKSRASVGAQFANRAAALDQEARSQADVVARTENIRQRLAKQLNSAFDDGRIAVLARAEGDLSAASQAHSGDTGEPREISVIPSEASDGRIGWSVASDLNAQNDPAQRTRILTTALAQLRLIKERIGLRLSLEDAEIRRAGLPVEQARAGLEKAEIALAQETLAQEIAVLKRAIERLEQRSSSFLADFQTRIRITLSRYVETAKRLQSASERLTTSCRLHAVGEIEPFDSTLLVDPGDDRDDDEAILNYGDKVEELERQWNQRIARSAGGLMWVGEFVLRPDPSAPGRLVAVQTWEPPTPYCFVEGVLIEAPAAEKLGFACELVGRSITKNALTVVTHDHEVRRFSTIPVTAIAAGGPDREQAIVRGGYFASLVEGRKFRLDAEAKGRTSLTVTLFVEAFGLAEEVRPTDQKMDWDALLDDVLVDDQP